MATPPNIGRQDEEIDQIIEELNINDGPFTKEEYNKAKRSITEGKACGEDNIPPEVLKRCNLDEEILGFIIFRYVYKRNKHTASWFLNTLFPF